MPHDIVVTKDGSVFVGDAASDSVIKFVPSESKLRLSLCIKSVIIYHDCLNQLNALTLKGVKLQGLACLKDLH